MSEEISIPFWKTRSLEELSHDEWESLCDGCGHCCLVKLEDEDTAEIFLTNVTCRLLDTETCRCSDYAHRMEKVSTCLLLSADKPELFRLLPETCAYRCLSEGRDLPDWHPLVSQQQNAALQQGVSVRDYAISETYIHPDQIHLHVIKKL